MPTEEEKPTSLGALIDPMGAEPTALSKIEHLCLKECLEVLRSENLPLHKRAIQIGASSQRDRGEFVLYCIAEEYRETQGFPIREWDSEPECGVLIHSNYGDGHFPILSEHECRVLIHTLTTLRLKSWFGEWLGVQVYSIANANNPDDRFPAPLKIASTLTDWIKEDQDRLEAARDFARMRPDLLFPVDAVGTPEPPAAPETTRPTSKPAKAQRAPKRKKVARA